jgi:hypothetical protein
MKQVSLTAHNGSYDLYFVNALVVVNHHFSIPAFQRLTRSASRENNPAPNTSTMADSSTFDPCAQLEFLRDNLLQGCVDYFVVCSGD